MKEAIQVHERRTKDYQNSFVRLHELVDLGLAKIRGRQVISTSEEAEITSEILNQLIALGLGPDGYVLGMLAGAIAWVPIGGFPVPVISGLTPDETVEDVADLVVTITGTDFDAAATVTFNGAGLTSVTWNSSTSISIVVPASLLTTVGTFDVIVTNPGPPGGGPSNAFGFDVISALTPVAWDAATHGADITLSGSNYIATRGAAADAWRSVRGNVGKSSGKWYWEVFVNTNPTAGGHIMLGAATSAQSQTSYPGNDATGRGAQGRPTSTPLVYASGSSSTPSASSTNITINSVVGFAL
ncbi:MAG: hypothetical protein ACRCV5_14390, partial [Afipia sp.]